MPPRLDSWLTRRQYGVGVPKGEVARSAAEAEKIAKEIGTRMPNIIPAGQIETDSEQCRWG